MRKLFVCALMLGVMSMLSAGLPSTALAQGDKDKKAKKDTKKASGAGVIEIREGKDGKFRFFVYTPKRRLLAMSGMPAFATKKEAEDGVEELKEIIGKAKVVMGEKKATDDEDDDDGKKKKKTK